MLLVVLFILAALSVAAGIYDAIFTEQGIKKQVGVENNNLIKLFFGDKPSAIDLYLYNSIVTALYVGISTVAFLKGSGNIPYIGIGGGIAGLIVNVLKHIQGGLLWRYLIRGGKLDPDGFPVGPNGTYKAHSALAKFIGPWIW